MQSFAFFGPDFGDDGVFFAAFFGGGAGGDPQKTLGGEKLLIPTATRSTGAQCAPLQDYFS